VGGGGSSHSLKKNVPPTPCPQKAREGRLENREKNCPSKKERGARESKRAPFLSGEVVHGFVKGGKNVQIHEMGRTDQRTGGSASFSWAKKGLLAVENPGKKGWPASSAKEELVKRRRALRFFQETPRI